MPDPRKTPERPRPPLSPVARALFALSLAFAAFPAFPAGQAEDERVLDGRTERLADLSASACVACHEPVASEWRESTHATAWIDERYQRALSKVRRSASCTGCHVPIPLSLTPDGARPAARETHRELGVHCATCHLASDGETVLGPLGLETPAHPSAKDPRLVLETSSATCLPCHATTIGPVVGVGKDFVATGQEELGLSCVGCHMPLVRRPLANRLDASEAEPPVRRARSHRVLGPRDPAFLRRAFDLSVEPHAGRQPGIVLVISNGAGHRVPGMKERRFVFDTRLVDGDGRVVDQVETTFDSRAYLPVDQERRITLEGHDAARLEVRARHEAPGLGRGSVFLERSFELPE